MFVSSIFCYDSDGAFKVMLPIIATYLLSFSVLILAQKGDNTNMLALGFISLFIAIFYFTLTSDTFSTNFDYANEYERRENTELNSNQYAYFSLFAIMSVRLMLGKRNVKRPVLRLLLYFILAGLSFYVALMTASRQVMLLEIPVLLFFVYYDFLRSGSLKGKILILGIIILLLAFIVPQAMSLYDDSYLAVRSSEDLQEDSRSFLLLLGWQQGMDNPLIGLGLGAETEFTHCTYTHLMARCGIPALIIYIVIIVISITEQFHRYNKIKDSYFLLYLFFTIVFAVANFFYSYIDQPYMMTILFLIIGDSNKRFRQYNNFRANMKFK